MPGGRPKRVGQLMVPSYPKAGPFGIMTFEKHAVCIQVVQFVEILIQQEVLVGLDPLGWAILLSDGHSHQAISCGVNEASVRPSGELENCRVADLILNRDTMAKRYRGSPPRHKTRLSVGESLLA